MPDIDRYPGILLEGEQVPYPENARKAKAVFDFENFCRKNGDYFISQLFSGRSLKEISNDRKGAEAYYMAGDTNIEPIFVSKVPKN
jgi:hypothetical protein